MVVGHSGYSYSCPVPTYYVLNPNQLFILFYWLKMFYLIKMFYCIFPCSCWTCGQVCSLNMKWSQSLLHVRWKKKKKRVWKTRTQKFTYLELLELILIINAENEYSEHSKKIETFFLTRGQIFMELWEITLTFDYPGFELLTMWLSATYLTFGALILSCVTHKERIIEFIW